MDYKIVRELDALPTGKALSWSTLNRIFSFYFNFIGEIIRDSKEEGRKDNLVGDILYLNFNCVVFGTLCKLSRFKSIDTEVAYTQVEHQLFTLTKNDGASQIEANVWIFH